MVAVIICVREAIPHFYLRSQQYSCHIVTSTRRHRPSPAQPSPAQPAQPSPAQPSPAQPSPARARTQVKVGWWCWCACARAASPCSLYSALSCPPGPPAASPAQHALLCGSYFIHDSHFTACCCCPHCKLQQKQLREKIATLGRFAKLLFAQSARQPAVNLCFYGAENWNYY